VNPVLKLASGETIQLARLATSASVPQRHVLHLCRRHAFDHRGSNHGRGERIDRDARLGELFAGALHETDHARFGRRVGAHARIAILPGNRRD